MSGNAELPRLTPEELRDGGYLQEVNHQFFHPLGLALALVPIQSDSLGDREGWDLAVIDERPDLEGWRFEGIDLRPKAAFRAAELAARKPARLAALGYVVQPPGDGS